MSNAIGAVLITSLAWLAAGCGGEPVVDVRRVIPAGDHVLLEVVAATAHPQREGCFGPGYVEEDQTAYLLEYHPEGAFLPDRGGRVPWLSQWPSSRWGEPFFRADMKGFTLAGTPGDETAAALRAAPDGKGWEVLRRWSALHPRESESFVPSTDGRYLAVLLPAFEVIDAKTLQPVADEDGSLRRMFDRARQISGRPPAFYALTRRLSYLAFLGPSQGNGDLDVVEALGAAAKVPSFNKPGGRRFYVIERRTGKVVATPGDEGNADHSLSGIDETDAGELRLLYADVEQAGTYPATLVDGQFKAVGREAVGPIWNGQRDVRPGMLLDAAHHCVWFVASAVFHRPLHGAFLTFYRWDYQSGQTRTLSLNVGDAFRPGGPNFVFAPPPPSRPAARK